MGFLRRWALPLTLVAMAAWYGAVYMMERSPFNAEMAVAYYTPILVGAGFGLLCGVASSIYGRLETIGAQLHAAAFGIHTSYQDIAEKWEGSADPGLNNLATVWLYTEWFLFFIFLWVMLRWWRKRHPGMKINA